MHFIQYLFLGIILSATPGVVLFEVIRRGIIRDRKLPTFLVGTYVSMIIIACVTILAFNLIDGNQFINNLFLTVNGVLLIYIGYLAVKCDIKEGFLRHIKKSKRMKMPAAFVSGFLITMTSPSRWAIWISFIGSLKDVGSNGAELNLCAACFAIGSVIFYSFLGRASFVFGKKLPTNILHIASKVMGLIIILYGVVNLCNAAVSIFNL